MRKNNHPYNNVAVSVARILVGLLFIISGLIKANDPLGLSYKMQEFFEVWNTDLSTSAFFLKKTFISLFENLHEHSLFLSLLMISLEIMTGIALLIGWQKKLILYSLFILIVFFTFLTGYAYGSGKFKNCGCFGDCLPITPLTSFIKDLLLLFLILFLLAKQKLIQPIATNRIRTVILLCFLIFTIGFQWYVLTYLPVADCLPFKKGNNIAVQMKPPPGARPDSFGIRFIYKKEGKQYEFSPSNFPADLSNYTFVDRIDKLIKKGNAEAPIKGFSLIGTVADSTNEILNQDAALVLFHLKNPNNKSWISNMQLIRDWAVKNNVPVYITTSTKKQMQDMLAGTSFNNLPLFTTDVTVIRTASRTSITLYYLKKGTIINKWSNASFKNALHFLESATTDNHK